MCPDVLRQSGKNLLLALICASIATGASAQTAQTERPLFDLERTSVEGLSDAWQNVDFAQPARPKRDGRSIFRDIAGDFGRFFSTPQNYAIMVVGAGGSLGFRSLDKPIANSGFNTEINNNDGHPIDSVFEPGEVLGGMAMQMGGALTAYGLGHWLDKPGMAEFGRDLLRAQILTQGVTHVMKRVARRTRPDESNKKSFPSGHTSGAFATATVFQKHYGWKVGIAAYSIAGYIGASRIAENKHYLTDLVFGAAVGIAAGRTVTFGKGQTQFELAPLAAPGGGGIHVTISRDR
jgi:hypothetical protein